MSDIDILAPDRFEELDAKLEEIEALLDDPDVAGNDPQAFLDTLASQLQEAANIAKQLTPEDFELAYAESEGEENDEEENGDGLGGLGS